MKRTLAVGITYHNEGPLLTTCLESLLKQQGAPEQILVFDDASKEPVQKFIPTNYPVRVIRSEENIGPAKGRNILLKSSTTEFVHFHDADDFFFPDWCKKVRNTMTEGNWDAIFTEVNSYRDQKVHAEKVIGLDKLKESKDLLGFCIDHFMLVPAGTYRKTVIDKLGGYREDLWQSEDFDFHVRLAALNPKYRVVSDPLVGIRLRQESRSQNRQETSESTLQAIELLSKELPPETHKKLSEKAAKMGSLLYQLGHKDQSRKAFDIAMKLGPPEFSEKRPMYRKLARTFGPQTAEWVGSWYRRFK